MGNSIPITGTDIWYYFICKRELWLSIHKIFPDQEDENIEIGRFIHEYRYGREKQEVSVGSIKIDRIKREKNQIVLREIKKSSRYLKSSRYQLLYYLYTFRQMGIEARGELSFPEEKKIEKVELNDQTIKDLENAMAEIRVITSQPIPPPPVKIIFCRHCAYREYCWAEG